MRKYFHQLLSHYLSSLLKALITWNHTPKILDLDYCLEFLATLPNLLDATPLYINTCLNEAEFITATFTMSSGSWLLPVSYTHLRAHETS